MHEQLNYTHLRSFWAVARTGSIRGACELLGLTQPTISKQIGDLESTLHTPLFERRGRRLVITEFGRTVHAYADDIFRLGQELADVVRGSQTDRPMHLRVGVSDSVAKLLTREALAPVLAMDRRVHLECVEGKHDALLVSLALGRADVIISDRPVERDSSIRAYSHRIATSAVAVFGAPALVASLEGPVPGSLDGTPVLLPNVQCRIRAAIDVYLEEHDVHPMVVGEFDDTALLKAFAHGGHGLFFAPALVAGDIERQYGVSRIATIDTLRESVYAITSERKVQHPGVDAMLRAASRRSGDPGSDAQTPGSARAR